MAGSGSFPHNTTSGPYPSRWRGLRSYREQAPENDVSDGANAEEAVRQTANRNTIFTMCEHRLTLYSCLPPAPYATTARLDAAPPTTPACPLSLGPRQPTRLSTRPASAPSPSAQTHRTRTGASTVHLVDVEVGTLPLPHPHKAAAHRHHETLQTSSTYRTCLHTSTISLWHWSAV
jgi:hypothetical protein